MPCRAVPALQNNLDATAASVISQFVPVPGTNGDTVQRTKRLGGMASIIADLNNVSTIATVSSTEFSAGWLGRPPPGVC